MDEYIAANQPVSGDVRDWCVGGTRKAWELL